jgi:hypothetical protein
MMSGWVAGTVRSRALARRRLGAVSVRQLAASPSLDDALAALVDSPYGHDVRAGLSLEQAQHAVASTLLWNLRVLAGWLPQDGVNALRAVTAWFELQNVQASLTGRAGTPYQLGTLATAWPRLAQATTPTDLRRVLATSAWGDPGTDVPAHIGLAMRLTFGLRLASALPEAAVWVRRAAVLQLARIRFAEGSSGPAAPELTRLLGPRTAAAVSWPELVGSLSPDVGHVLAGVDGPELLWRAELGWWQGVEADASGLLRQPGFGRPAVCGAIGLLAVDAWRVRAALEMAARGGRPMEVFDDVA